MNFMFGARKDDKDVLIKEMTEYEEGLYNGDISESMAKNIAKKHVKKFYHHTYENTFVGLYSDNKAALIAFTLLKKYKNEFIVHDIVIVDDEEYMDYIQENIYTEFITYIEELARLTSCNEVYLEESPQNTMLQQVCLKLGYELKEANDEELLTSLYHKDLSLEKEKPQTRKLVP